jgi:ABC-type phosphate transport system auxiliary subunit
MERLEKERIKLANRLNELRQQEKDIQSGKINIRANEGWFKNLRDEISKLEREIIEKVMVLQRMDGAWKRETKRREKCPIKSELCPLSPIREACQ